MPKSKQTLWPEAKAKQTRLLFDPLPSSSPAASQYPSQMQERAAAVRYDDEVTPTKKRRIGSSITNGLSSSPSSPTPKKNANIAVMVSSDRKRGLRSGYLPTPAPSSQILQARKSEEDISTSSDSPVETVPRINVNPFGYRADFHDSDDLSSRVVSSTEEKHPDVPTAFKTTTKTNGTLGMSNNRFLGVSRLSSNVTKRQPSPPDSNSRIPGQDARDSHDTSSDSDEITTSRPPAKTRKASALLIVSSDESSNDEIVTFSNAQNQSGRPSPETRGSQNRNSKSITPRSRSFLLGGSTGSVPISGSPSYRRTPTRSMKSQRAGKVTKLSKSSKSTPTAKQRILRSGTTRQSQRSRPQPNEISESEVQTSDGQVSPGEEDEESEEEVVSPRNRKRLSRHILHPSIKSPVSSRDRSDDDIEEDVEDLQETEIRQSRTRTRNLNPKKSAAKEQLERLRRSRAVRTTTGVDGETASTQTSPHTIISDEDQSQSEVEVTDDDQDSGLDAIRQSLRNKDSYDDDFVTDNEDEDNGDPVAELAEMPHQFTRYAHKQKKEHFKDAVEWMVHNKLNPAFAREDPVYRTAFYKLDDEVQGYSSSKFLSAAWSGDFARAIRARPFYCEVTVSTMLDHRCDACNRSGHPAKHRITFGGNAYHQQSLEAVVPNEDEDEEDSDTRSCNSAGNRIPSTDQEYFVGRFCKANAEIAHALLHWRYHLNDWVIDWLKNSKHYHPEKIIERDGWSIKKKSDYANKVVDEMEEKGQIKELYREFQSNLDAARGAKSTFRDR